MVDKDLHAALDQELSRLVGPDVENVESGAGRDVLLAAARQVVHNQHPVAGFDKGVGHMAADKTRTTGDTNG